MWKLDDGLADRLAWVVAVAIVGGTLSVLYGLVSLVFVGAGVVGGLVVGEGSEWFFVGQVSVVGPVLGDGGFSGLGVVYAREGWREW